MNTDRMKVALTIAGSDPSGGAGLQADLKVFARFGVYGLSAVSAITVQNTFAIADISPVSESLLDAQLTVLLNDIRPDALKTGMLYSRAAIRTVARIVKGFDLMNLVIDPVTVSSTGTSLVEEGALEVLKKELFPFARVITPNIYEAQALSGVSIQGVGDMERACRALLLTGCETVIITGGHLERETLDLLFDGEELHRVRGERTRGEYHGTGCAYSAAIAAHLAKGGSVLEAARKAKGFVDAAIAHAHAFGRGMRLLDV